LGGYPDYESGFTGQQAFGRSGVKGKDTLLMIAVVPALQELIFSRPTTEVYGDLLAYGFVFSAS